MEVDPNNLIDIITEISHNYKNFDRLTLLGHVTSIEEASAIVTYLPKIKFLVLQFGRIRLASLVMILQGCKELVNLDIRYARGFKIDDKILEMTSYITMFKYSPDTSK